MSDQDFIFDEDEQPKQPEKQPAESTDSPDSSTPAPASSDFFFDEEEEPKQAAKQPAKASASAGSAAPVASAAPQTVTTTVTALVGVVALLVGVILGIFVGQSLAGPSVPATTAVPGQTGAVPGAQQAPQLSPEQMQGGELPKGHPDIGSMNGTQPSSATTTP